MFNDRMNQVLLIHKNHGPKCVVGRWNGIGGHREMAPPHIAEQDDVFGKPSCICGCQEGGETPIQCQIREFDEETGVMTTEKDWAQFTKLEGEDFIVHCFWGISNYAVLNAKTMTDEKVEIWNNPASLNIPLAPNLKWMLPFLMDGSTKNHLCVVLANYKKDDNLDPDSVTTI